MHQPVGRGQVPGRERGGPVREQGGLPGLTGPDRLDGQAAQRGHA